MLCLRSADLLGDDTTYRMHHARARFRSLSSISPPSHSARMRHSTVEFRGLLARPSRPPSVRPSVRPSLSLSLSPSPSVIRRSTLAVAVATVARSSRIVAAARRRTPSLAPALLSLSAKSAEEGRRGRARAISLRPNVPRPTSRLGSRRVTERE